ncbi:hypothetical protein IWX49DRAFT_152920 [Phyllosticta citricarpa]|uniref:Uncharacterized protein n=2 Tax=Phyllosticta TaxID=121621 RepID=A0ABR1MI04_9PEZI
MWALRRREIATSFMLPKPQGHFNTLLLLARSSRPASVVADHWHVVAMAQLIASGPWQPFFLLFSNPFRLPRPRGTTSATSRLYRGRLVCSSLPQQLPVRHALQHVLWLALVGGPGDSTVDVRPSTDFRTGAWNVTSQPPAKGLSRVMRTRCYSHVVIQRLCGSWTQTQTGPLSPARPSALPRFRNAKFTYPVTWESVGAPPNQNIPLLWPNQARTSSPSVWLSTHRPWICDACAVADITTCNVTQST